MLHLPSDNAALVVLRRWERAAANGLSPPPHIKQVLLEHAADERLKWSVLENLVTSHPKVAA
jgi:DNA polymerase delta, subunit 4